MPHDIEILGKEAFQFLREQCASRQLPFDTVLQAQIKGLAAVAATTLDKDDKQRIKRELNAILDHAHQSSM